MPKLIHTIKIQSERSWGSTVSSTRETTGRRYLACLVATTTEESVRLAEARRVELEQLVVTTKVALDAACAKWGVTLEQAKANHKERSDQWFGHEEGFFATQKRIRATIEAKNGGRFYLGSVEPYVEADMTSRGFVNPFDQKNTDYEVVQAGYNHDSAVSGLQRETVPVLGSQAVISWHQSVELAKKSLGSSFVDTFRQRGDRVDVRTDIDIREVQPRAKKAP